MKGCFAIPLGQVFAFEAWQPHWPLILLGSMGGIESSLGAILLMCFSFFLLVLSWFLGGFVRLGSAAFSKSHIWIFRFYIFLGRVIKLQIHFLNMLWSFRQILGGSLPRHSVLL